MGAENGGDSAALAGGRLRRKVEAAEEGIASAAKLREGVAVKAVADARSVDSALNEARFFELFEVARNRRLRQRQVADNFAADAFVPLREHLQDTEAGRMRKRLGLLGERSEIGFEAVGGGEHKAAFEAYNRLSCI